MRQVLSIVLLLFSLLANAQRDSANRKSFTYKSLIVPASLVGLGVYSRLDVPFGKEEIQDLRNEHFANFHTTADDYLQFAPIAVGYSLGVINGWESKNDFINKSAILFKSEVFMTAAVLGLKYSVKDQRPNNGAFNAWPSGHTAQAFVAASFLDHEYRHKSVWISVAGYTCASTVGILRILNNRHWSADVLAGAGIGILATNIAYATHQYKWKNFKFLQKNNVSILPYYQNRQGGIIFSTSL